MKLQTVTYSESNELFAVFKQYMMPTIDGAIGWDEDFQFDGFVENLKRDWFRWLIVRNEKAGLVCFRTIESRTHIHLLIVFHPFQRQGLARQFFRLIKSKHKSKCLSLSSLKNNKIAIYMYTKYGFKVIAEDEHFYSFIKFNTNREVP